MKIYLACSFAYEDKTITEYRKGIMQMAEDLLTMKGHDVYNPSKLKIENAWDYSMWDWGEKVYEADKNAILDSDIVVFVSFGKENNAGSVWEVGFATAKDIPVIVVSMIPDQPESLMVLHSAHTCLDGLYGMNSLDEYDFKTMPRHKIERTES